MDKMSKVTKRKITVDSSNSSSTNGNSSNSNSNSNKDSQKRQSVFERLGTKTTVPIAINTSSQSSSSGETFCRHWAQNGSCAYGKSCKFANTHILISPSKRAAKKDTDIKVGSRSGEESKRLLSSVVKRERISPEVDWDSWDQTVLEYEDEKVLEKRRQLLQRELELQMKREEKERSSSHHSSRPKHSLNKDKKGASSSSSTSVSSTSSTESSSSSDESSSGTSSTSGVGIDSKRRKTKSKKLKRGSTSSASDIERISRKKSRDGKKDSSPSLMKKSGSRIGSDSLKKVCSPPPPKVSRKSSSLSSRNRKKSCSPISQRSGSNYRRHAPSTPPPLPSLGSSLKNKTSKLSSGSARHRDPSPRSSSRRSVSPSERKEKHNRSISPRLPARDRERDKERGRSRSPKAKPRDRTPPLPVRRIDNSRSRRKDSPDLKNRGDKRSARKFSPKRDNRLQDIRTDDRKKDDDRPRTGKDDRRTDRKLPADRTASNDRDKRDHAEESARAREKAREAAREKERFEALERCRERQREREQLAKEKEKARERGREDREKELGKGRDYDRDIPSLLTIATHNPTERKNDRDRGVKDRKDREKERVDKERDRPYDRTLDKSADKGRLPERIQDRERLNDKNDRDRGNDKDRRGIEREHLVDRNRNDKPSERDRSFDRERVLDRERLYDRGSERERIADRNFDREKERNKVPERPRERDREFDRERIHEKDRDRPFDRGNERERSYERNIERDKSSLEKDRGVVRDRGLERVLERERNKSLERGRGSDSERSLDRGRDRERYERERDTRYEPRRPVPADDKGYDSPFEGSIRRERGRYPPESTERVHYSPTRDDPRNIRIQPPFNDDRRRREGQNVRNWEYDDGGPKGRDWDFPDNRREWDSRNRRGVEDWEGNSDRIMETENWGRFGPCPSSSGDWSSIGGGGVSVGDGVAGSGGVDWHKNWSPSSSRAACAHHSPAHTIIWDPDIDDYCLDSRMRRTGHANENIESELQTPPEKETSEPVSSEVGPLKRPREESEVITPELKKPRLEEPAANVLEEALSDISDDPDEILNRDDTETLGMESEPVEEEQPSSVPVVSVSSIPRSQQSSTIVIQPSSVPESLDQSRLTEERVIEEEGEDNLDFEEISDEELEEDARANKGLGDALGVDWASLVAETRPKHILGDSDGEPGAARRRWEPTRILQRIGISLKYAGAEMYNDIQEKAIESSKDAEGEEEGELQEVKPGLQLQHPVAGVHVTLRLKHAQRRTLFSGVDTFKRALSARRDIAIRRQLCNLPVRSLELQQAAGMCQWVV